ncbi:hypothetical protein PV773_00485 [Mesorhizobium sp. CC13]|uniref:hypothetical protein n=1 Tax=Mesorhizobium sp. CC13 TaxID=3029194 RepID=UPI0032653B21
MRIRTVPVIAFPLLVLLLLAGERAATVLLGQFPADPGMWRAWLALRALFGNFWFQVDSLLGTSIGMQFVALAAVAALCTWLARALRAGAFLVNHTALLFVAAAFATSYHARTASVLAYVPGLETFMLPAGFSLDWLTGSVLALGLLACGYCHYLFLGEARRRARERTLRLVALERDL